MMKQIILLLSIISIIALSSCRKDFSTQASTGQLEFSKDTVFLDTIFNDIGSSTYALKVYNRSKNAITIPTIQLADGVDSRYRLNVDGIAGRSFENIDILAKDSIYVFIEVTVQDVSTTELLYVDELLFDSGSNQQDVKLVTLVQDAIFLRADKDPNGIIETLVIDGEETTIQGRYLEDDELIFTDEKPYVIYGYMMVGTESNEAKTLTIQAGANVHFHTNSGLFVNENSSLHVLGSLNVEGQPQTEVIFQGDRLEPEFENTPGQWDKIILFPHSLNNIINYATIKNGTIGILSFGNTTGTPVLEITNSQLYNNSLFGILGLQSNIKGSNLAINNSGLSAFSAMVGGTYNFTHCTFANSWSMRSTPNIWLLDSNIAIKREEDPLETANFSEFNFTNCIIDGFGNIELEFDQKGNDTFNYNFKNNLIQFNDVNNVYAGVAFYDFTVPIHYTDNIFNENPDFKSLQLNELNIGENSAGNGQAVYEGGTEDFPNDILGETRVNPADIGAYEHIIFEE